MKIRGKTAVVTGASSGLGRAIALSLARGGADVALVARREDLLRELAQEVEALGRRCLVVPTDVADAARVRSASQAIVNEVGTPDILVNSAGVAVWKPFLEISDAEHEAMMNVNFWGAYHWIRCLLPAMKERGSGHIINISAGTGKIGLPVTSGFSASKFALTGLSEALHREFLGTGLHVSCVHPGNIRTDFWDERTVPKQGLPALVRFSPKMSPRAVARDVVFFCVRLGVPVRTLPVFVALLTKVNALSIRAGDLMLWKWFFPLLLLVVALALL